MGRHSIQIETRLIMHSDRSGGEDACWNWTAAKRGLKKEYGTIKVNGKACIASRVAYELAYGPIPEGMFVCHRCDNPPCINPKHLFLGTAADNCADRDRKNRYIYTKGRNLRKGEAHPQAKLTNQQVLEIRQLHEQGTSYRQIAKQFNVGRSTVCDICHGNIWTHI